MDIGNLNIKLNFIDGLEDEPYIWFKIQDSTSPYMMIWEGYIEDLLKNPDLSGKGWIGLTRDYHEMKGIWDDDCKEINIDVSEFLNDLNNYNTEPFKFIETKEMFESLKKYLTYAKERGLGILAKLED